MTFQAVLFSNGSFLFQYKNISNIGIFDQTIGAENPDGGEGIQSMYASPVMNLSAVQFRPRVSGLGKPNYVKNTLISTAKDLSLSVYEQGSGRIQILDATRARIIADPATISFKMIKGVNTSVIRFYNLNTTSSRTLNLNAVVRDSSGNIVNTASLNTPSLIIAPNSSASVILTVDATSIPKSIYSGKLTALADNGENVGVIFGFAKMNELSINKIKFDGTPAAYESIMVYKTNATSEDSLTRFGSTDLNGMVTILVPDGEYNIWSGSFFNDTWIWTTKDKLSVTGDTSTTLDERLSVQVSFNPNKPNQKFASMDSVLDYYPYSSSLSSMNPSNIITRITPTSVNIAHSYEYYPLAYYNSSDPWRINTPEWHKLYFPEQGINSPKNYVADYSKLVRRNGVYKSVLIYESAGRFEFANNMSYSACICWAGVWQMDLPQQRIEYITPDTYYNGGLMLQNSSLSDWGYRSYPPASTPTDFWNAQPFSWSNDLYRSSNWLYLSGYALIDTGKHTYISSPALSNFTLYRNGIKIYNISTNGGFSYYNSGEPSTASYSAVIEGASNQNLAVRSRTVLNFSYTGSGDYKPPTISWQIPNLDMYNRLQSNTVEINLYVVEEKEYGFVNGTPDQLSSLNLEYSINDGATWNTVTLNSLGNGEYKATISGIQNNAFVSLRTKAIDISGNSASHELIKAFLINEPGMMADMFGVNNSIGAPNTFVLVPVNITNTQNGPIAGIVFDISFDPGIINLTKTRVQRGDIISTWDSPSFNPINGRISLVFGGTGTEIPDGTSGSVVVLNFSVVGASGSKSAINISRIQLSNPDGIIGTAPSSNGTFTVNHLLDNTPPDSIANLTNITYAQTYVNLTWFNPTDTDFSHVMLYLNGTFITNITAPQNYYNITGLTQDTEYELGTHTVDSSGNINETWVNATARTAPSGAAPVAVCGADKLNCENVGTPVQFNGSASYDLDGAIVSYYWDFGDGTNATGAVPNHTYSSYKWNGIGYEPFLVNFTVTDNSGLKNSTSQKMVIWIPGDANGDGMVNILDASVVGLNWNGNDPCVDLNNDGAVNILDASIIGLNWGKSAIFGG